MDDLVKLMIGRDLKDVYPKRDPAPGDVLLEVNNVSRSKLVHDVSFKLHAGEIVGFAGITGSGRTELVRAIFGADPFRGEMKVIGEAVQAALPGGCDQARDRAGDRGPQGPGPLPQAERQPSTPRSRA